MLWVLLFSSLVYSLPYFDARIASDDQAVNPSVLGSRFLVDFSLTNLASEPLTVCAWGTPLDKSDDVMRADMFNVGSMMGEPAPYIGIVMKRRPVISDFVTLQPGQTISSTINLLKGYWFPAAGHYTVSLQSYIYVFKGELETGEVSLTNFELYDLSSDALSLYVSSVSPLPELMIGNETNLGAVTVNANCDTSRASTVRTADSNAGTLINRVTSYMRGACGGGAYVTWMGVCDSSRYSTVTSNFNRISSRHSSGYRVDCAGSSCSANVYAYVYPTDTNYNVYVCGAFWSAAAPTCRADSQPGTIIHELSHFNSVAATKDVTYGQTNCQNLAKSNPASAITNADNHEYLSESCP